jgi:hypothetical protein
MNRRVRNGLVIVLMSVGTLIGAAESLRIVPIVRDDQVVVSFQLSDVFNEQVREAIGSGLRTTFTYDVELRMVVPAWVDRTVATAVVSASDQYDNLTRRHLLSRTIDGRVVDALVTDDEAVVRTWLTELTRVPLVHTSRLDPRREYYVRVAARTRPNGASILGWTTAVSGQARFTFIP